MQCRMNHCAERKMLKLILVGKVELEAVALVFNDMLEMPLDGCEVCVAGREWISVIWTWQSGRRRMPTAKRDNHLKQVSLTWTWDRCIGPWRDPRRRGWSTGTRPPWRPRWERWRTAPRGWTSLSGRRSGWPGWRRGTTAVGAAPPPSAALGRTAWWRCRRWRPAPPEDNRSREYGWWIWKLSEDKVI